MTSNAQRSPAAAPARQIHPQARQIAKELLESMNALLGTIERETELVRAGKLREALALEPRKTELSRRYVAAVNAVKTNDAFLRQSSPELLGALHKHHDLFRAMLQVNLTVLATAHAVSENIVREVNAEMQKRTIPNTYTAAGRRTAPSPRHIAPLSVSRSL